MLWRDVRAGELRLLGFAVMLAVAALSAVAFFSARLQGGLERDAAQLLGGDIVLSSDLPTPVEFTVRAASLGLTTTSTQTFPTMARSAQGQGGEGRLVMLKAVAAGYPLRGLVRVADQGGIDPAGQQSLRGPPAPGEVWVENALLDTLGLHVGQTLLLGDESFRIAKVLVQEPDRGNSLVNFAPRVLMNLSDLPATGLVQPASRVHYRLAMTGTPAAVQRYLQWARTEVQRLHVRGLTIDTLDAGNPQMQKTLGRAESFLNLVALLAAFLSAVAVALAARGFASRHLDDCALLRVLGMGQRTIAWAYAIEFLLLGLAGSLVGLAVGYGAHYGFVELLGGLVQGGLPQPGLQPVGFGLGVGMLLLATFGLPPVLQLAGTPPMRVIRREAMPLRVGAVVTIVAGLAGFAGLLLAASHDLRLGSIAVGGFALATVVFLALARLMLALLRAITQGRQGGMWPRWLVLAIRQLTARPLVAAVQIGSLAVGMLALLLLFLLRTDLVQSWRQASPVDAPNRFVINILPDQAHAFQTLLREAGVRRYDWYPMVRGRLVAVNGRDIQPDSYQDEQARRLVDREFNLSFSVQPPSYSPVEQGSWRSGDSRAISMEAGIMKTLGLHVGDRLRFDMGGVLRESTVTSVRKVDWSSMHVNFFAMYPVAGLGDEVGVTWITAYRSPPNDSRGASLDRRVLQTFPNVTQIDMTSAITQIQQVLNQVIGAVELLFSFGLVAGLVVLFATLNATRESRARDLALMRALGAGSGLLARMQAAELLLVGAVAGSLAGLVALGLAWVLARQVFDFAWLPAWWIVPAGAFAGALLAWLAGWWSLRELLRQPVVQTLRAMTAE
ncbi:ABC transporter permease [Brachymonas sp. M4Q-1]|uniref:ABC transporter permease n=1 Tax=Brachymonas sp. M4Q-1 TaxID=3416906 RepID=UPI003CEC1B8B